MTLDFESAFTERTPRIVNAAKLHRAAARKKAGRFLIEGENAVDAAVSTGAATDIFVTEHAAEKFSDILTAAGYMDVYVHPITDKAARHLADTVKTTGLFALCKPVLWSVGKILAGKPRLVSVPVETAEPGNAGTLIRTSDAMGADGVIFAGDTVDPLGSKVARASAGSLFHVPVARDNNIKDVLGQLRAAGLQILATAADGEVDLADAELAQPTAWLFGNEAHGLGELAQEADVRVRIPLRGRAESLNLATAASICLYESAKALEA
ncbi:TrmH family RNA methyltransferase [Corynebacterium flavescens]|uniref:TrmH family RNA methyltransferase n=1 Tax=Corynebacterium flavescens TaxID=28028 RepID=UPI0026477E3C|nr:RNA methyltransferase [Corynebacterium flavescens]MDN6431903.1 RNA methyltransferase [Corynebacterium flavescens]MDN6532042.1 RNA methyltransferase [Corynebacterium flavescens]MDN6601948.1 RNA methyltransferase [Corynebacterium flavescens]MDN6824157.1 RNA methyltransferase [Corynebacterium flavescens]